MAARKITLEKRRLYPIAETRHLLGGISEFTLQGLVKSGALRPVKIGRRTLYADVDIDSLVQRLRGRRAS